MAQGVEILRMAAGRSVPDERATATTASSNTTAKTFTVADMERLVRELEAMPKPLWTLIAPDGRVWQDEDTQALLRVLAMAVYAVTPCGVPAFATTTVFRHEFGPDDNCIHCDHSRDFCRNADCIARPAVGLEGTAK